MFGSDSGFFAVRHICNAIHSLGHAAAKRRTKSAVGGISAKPMWIQGHWPTWHNGGACFLLKA
jgi:hypothetical protein